MWMWFVPLLILLVIIVGLQITVFIKLELSTSNSAIDARIHRRFAVELQRLLDEGTESETFLALLSATEDFTACSSTEAAEAGCVVPDECSDLVCLRAVRNDSLTPIVCSSTAKEDAEGTACVQAATNIEGLCNAQGTCVVEHVGDFIACSSTEIEDSGCVAPDECSESVCLRATRNDSLTPFVCLATVKNDSEGTACVQASTNVDGICDAHGTCVISIAAATVIETTAVDVEALNLTLVPVYCDTFSRAQVRTQADVITLPNGCTTATQSDETRATCGALESQLSTPEAPLVGADGDADVVLDTFLRLAASTPGDEVLLTCNESVAFDVDNAFDVRTVTDPVYVRFAYHAATLMNNEERVYEASTLGASATPSIEFTICDSDAPLRCTQPLRTEFPEPAPESGSDAWLYATYLLPSELASSVRSYVFSFRTQNVNSNAPLFIDSVCFLVAQETAPTIIDDVTVLSTNASEAVEEDCNDAAIIAFTLASPYMRHTFDFAVPFEVALGNVDSVNASHTDCRFAYDDGVPLLDHMTYDVWLRFNTSIDVTCTIGTCGLTNFDTSLLLYDVTSTTCDAFTTTNVTINEAYELACNGDGAQCYIKDSTDAYASALYGVELEADHTYTLRVGAYDYSTSSPGDTTVIAFTCSTW